MKKTLKKVWGAVGVTGLIIAAIYGELIYMNLRSADPILPGWEEYDEARFNSLMASDEPVLVEIYASWCPTCLLQHRALETLHHEGRGPKIRAIRVDFDRDTRFVEERGIRHTGTMVIYKHGQQRARASGLVTPEKIEVFLANYTANAAAE